MSAAYLPQPGDMVSIVSVNYRLLSVDVRATISGEKTLAGGFVLKAVSGTGANAAYNIYVTPDGFRLNRPIGMSVIVTLLRREGSADLPR